MFASFRPPFRLLFLAAILPLPRPLEAAAPGTPSPQIIVDQLGYQPAMSKVAVLSDPQTGFNAVASYTPGATLQLRSWSNHAVVFSGSPVPWNGGATHAASGDKVWWFDFSSVRKWGEYYVYDPASDLRSDRFRIAPDVYSGALRQATRVFYYQRRGLAKPAQFAGAKWADAASHLGPQQDPHCRLISDKSNSSLERDLQGGWFDAGDYNKYVNFTASPLRDLLLAYENQPLLWPDDTGLPESGNGIPDLLDEVKWELEWLRRMQQPDGSVLSKVAVDGFQGASPPSSDTSAIYYGAASTSATFTAAGAFAQAAKVFSGIGQTAYASTLRSAAEAAWNWGVANPSVTFTNAGFSSANPEVSAYERGMLKLGAAIHLYALTSASPYRTYVEANYLTAQPMQWYYWYGFEPAIQDSLLYYTALPGISPTVANEIRSRKQASMNGSEFLPAFTSGTDAYRAYLKNGDYVWGSNAVKCRVGHLFQQQLTWNLDPANAASYRAAAEGYLHYLQGVNPLSMMYLTNLYSVGGDRCANEMYHTWFGDSTAWDNALTSSKGPPPGYLTGGANGNWSGPDAAYTGPLLDPPLNQPVQKAYRDWNTSWPQNSWEFTEPGIYYQAAYVRLLAGTWTPPTYTGWLEGYALSGADALALADPDKDGVSNLAEFALGLSPASNDSAAWPTATLSPDPATGTPARYLTITLPRRAGSGLTYIVEASPNLKDWTPVCTTTGNLPASGPGLISETGTGPTRQLTARDTESQSATRRYLRVSFRLD